MLESFKNPPAEYRVTPFWFWNSRLEIDEIERQVREMHSKGVGGFFIHGRFGLRTEYMGEAWMRCIERACDVAGELGMHVYLYDENPFPSGVAGGEAMKSEQHFNKFLDIVRRNANAGETVSIALPEGELVAAVAIDQGRPEAAVDITGKARNRTLKWTAPAEGNWEVLAFVAAVARFKGFIYGSEPDYFEKGLVDTFFAFTHERYAARLKRYFGGVIKGIFTDEPKIQCIHHMHEDANTTAWFGDLLQRFADDHGYDLRPHLACLAADAGPMTGKVRRDFWSTVTRCYIERFFARYRDWCEDNGIALTGHLFLEEGLYANTMYQGDFPRVLSTFHIPGVDHLALVAEGEYAIRQIPASVTRVHGQKLGSSVAHAAGLDRVLSETYGCCGWSLSLEHMKWIFDWQAAMGINLLCPHAFYYSLAGARKTDAPPSQFYQACYWPHYGLFADYAARICYALSQGVHRAQAALLYPIKGFHSEWAPGRQGPLDSLIAEYFDAYCAEMMKQHIDYDILTEDALRGAMSVDQRLVLAGEEYEMLIIPPTTAIGYGAAMKVREFVQDGGAALATVLLPLEDADGDRHAQVRNVFEEIFGEDPLELRERAIHGRLPDEPCLRKVEGGGMFFSAASPAQLSATLRRVVCEGIKPEVSAECRGEECADITFVHRRLEDADLFFFSNNCAEPREVQLSIRCDGAPRALDPETGSSAALANCTQIGSRTVLPHRFERRGSLLIYFSREPELSVDAPPPRQGKEIPLADEWRFEALGPNCLILDDWQLCISTHQDFTSYKYTARFEAEHVPADLLLVLDDMPEISPDAGCAGSSCSVTVNDRPAVDRCPWVIDVGFQAINIAGLVRKGTNQLQIVIEHGGWSGDPQLMLAEARVMGRFALGENRRTVLEPAKTAVTGSWTEQGYPFYSGCAAYSQTVELPEFSRGQRILIRADRPADMAEFVINGASAGTRAWAPFEVEITPLVKPGPNTVEIRVTNSLSNMLLSDPRSSGLLGGASILIA